MKVFGTIIVLILFAVAILFAGSATAAPSSPLLTSVRKLQTLQGGYIAAMKKKKDSGAEKQEQGRNKMDVQQLPGDDGVGAGASPETPQESFDISDFNLKDPKCAASIGTWSISVSMDCTTQQLADFGKDAYTDAEANTFFEKFANSKCAQAMGKKFADLGAHCIGATAEVAAKMVEASVTKGVDGNFCGVEFQRVSRYQACNNATNSSECIKMQGCAVAQEIREGANNMLPRENGDDVPSPRSSSSSTSRARFTCDAKAEARDKLCSSSCLKSFIEKNSKLIDQLQNQKMFRELKEAGRLCDPAEAPGLLSTTAAPFALTESPDEAAPVTAPVVTFDFGDGIGDGRKPNGDGGEDDNHRPTNSPQFSHHHGHHRDNNNNNGQNNNDHRHNHRHHSSSDNKDAETNDGKKHVDDAGAQNSVAPNPLAPDTPVVGGTTNPKHLHHASGSSSSANTRSSSGSSTKGAAVGVLGAMFVVSMVVIAFLLHQKRQQFNRRRRRTGGFTNPNDDDIDIESDVDDLDYGNEPATAAAAGVDGGSNKNGGVQVGQIVMDDGTVASLPAVLANAQPTTAAATLSPAPPVVLPAASAPSATRFDDPNVRPSIPESPVISDGV